MTYELHITQQGATLRSNIYSGFSADYLF